MKGFEINGMVLSANNYAALAPDKRKKLCRNIIDTALAKMQAPVDSHAKMVVMLKVLKDFMTYSEEQQDFESCIIMRDIVEVIDSEYINGKED